MTAEDEEVARLIQRVAADIQTSSANNDEVKQVLYEFCFCVAHDRQLSPELTGFLKDAFESYIFDHARSLDQAFGLIRKKTGRPAQIENTEYVKLATDLLATRLAGSNHQDSLDFVAELHHCGKTKVAEAWRTHKGQAVPNLLAKRLQEGKNISKAEWAQIRKIYRKPFEEMKRWLSKEPPTIAPEN